MKIIKISGSILCTALIIAMLLNPSENDFKSYVASHAQNNYYRKQHPLQAGRQANYILWSVYYTRGETLSATYYGYLGEFHFNWGTPVEQIDYFPSEW